MIMSVLVCGFAAAMILAALAFVAAALTWAAYIRRMGDRARRQEARAEARRLAPVCEAELKPEHRVRYMIVERLAGELERRGYEGVDDLADDAVGEMMAERT